MSPIKHFELVFSKHSFVYKFAYNNKINAILSILNKDPLLLNMPNALKVLGLQTVFIYNLIWYVLKIKAIRSSYMLYFQSLGFVQHDIIVVYTCYVVFMFLSTWVVPVFQLEYRIITLRICRLFFKFVFWGLVSDMQAS
jgi:hypothetical protein